MHSSNPSVIDLLSGFSSHPAELAERYRDAGVFDGKSLWQLLADTAEKAPESPALTDTGCSEHHTLTYRELCAAALQRAAGFVASGLLPGERVVVQQNNTAALVINLFGLIRAGVTPVLSLPAHRMTEITHLASTAGATAYITEDGRHGFDYRELAVELQATVPAIRFVFVDGAPGDFAALPESSDPNNLPDLAGTRTDGPALFLVSGGTTGLPKLIARTHDDYTYNARQSAAITRSTSNDVYLAALPITHNFPLCCPGILGMVAVGGHTILTNDPSPDNSFELIEKYRVTVTSLVPALAQVWLAATEWETADIGSLRLLQVGGSKLAEPVAQALDKSLGDIVQQVFGMAEGLICYTRLDDPREVVHRVQGAPMSSLDEIRIVDENGAEVPDGTPGELLVRGPYTIRGYYRADEHNLRSFTPDGFYRSGDRVCRTPTGHLMVTGRLKDTIIRGGENVAADDVEEHLLAHHQVGQVAVCGLPDEALGEKIWAAVVLNHGPSGEAAPTLAELRQFLLDRGLARFKLPDMLTIVPRLPVTAVGKIDKSTLRASLMRGAMRGGTR